MNIFEEYNHKFAYLQRTDDEEEPHIQDLARDLSRWPEALKKFPQDKVFYASYLAPDHEEWQKFRVSLREQSTKMKLARLWTYLQSERSKAGSIGQWDLCEMRVNSYLEVLMRAGFLDKNLVIIR